MGETATRYLAAILAADVVGYSRLMGADEDGTLARVQALFAEVAGPAVAARQGRIFKTMGDAFLAEFPSAVGAVLCAAEVQQALAAREAGRPEAARLRLRVGVHLGDVVPQGADLFGDGVNIAARLEGVAEPGGVAMSATVAEAVRGKLPFGLEDLGEKALKNIERPVRVFRLVVAGAAVPKPARRRLGALAAGLVVVALALGGVWWAWRPVGEPVADAVPLAGPAPAATALAQPAVQQAPLSIVVLPFANLSGDPAQGYVAEGLSSSITADLSRISGSLVIAPSTANTYRNRDVDIRQVGRELDVRYVLQGGVQRGGGRYRVNASLADTGTGAQLWAERMEGPEAELFDAQDQITGRIALATGRQMVVTAARDAGRRADSASAVDAYLRALALAEQPPSLENSHAQEAAFTEALRLDPGNLDAMARLARAITLPGILWADRISREEYLDRARRASETARSVIALDPLNSRAYWALALSLSMQRDTLAADRAQARASELDPNSMVVIVWAGLKTRIGQPRAAIELSQRGLRLDPRSPQFAVAARNMAWGYGALGDLDLAIEWFEKSRAANPTIATTLAWLAISYARQGRDQQANAVSADLRRQSPNFQLSKTIDFTDPSIPVSYRRYLEEIIIPAAERAGVPL